MTTDAQSGSEQRMVVRLGPSPPSVEWFEYLEATGAIRGYEGCCQCYSCKAVRAGYEPWRASKREGKAHNAEVCGDGSKTSR